MSLYVNEILPLGTVATCEPSLIEETTVAYDVTMYELDREEAAHSISVQLSRLGCECRVVTQREFCADYYYLSGELRYRAEFILEIPRRNEHEVLRRVQAWLRDYDFSDSDISPRRVSATPRRQYDKSA